MRHTRTVRDENAVSFREYIEILEQRRQEDLARYEKDREKSEEERKLDLAKYEKDRKKAEERYNLDRKDWQERYTEAKKENTQAYKNLRNFIIGAIITPILIAVFVYLAPWIMNNSQNNVPTSNVSTQSTDTATAD